MDTDVCQTETLGRQRVSEDLNVVRQVLWPHGRPGWSHSKWGDVSARREMSKSVRREAHDLKHLRSHLDVSMSKWVRLLNAGVYGAFLADGVGEDEWDLPPTR